MKSLYVIPICQSLCIAIYTPIRTAAPISTGTAIVKTAVSAILLPHLSHHSPDFTIQNLLFSLCCPAFTVVQPLLYSTDLNGSYHRTDSYTVQFYIPQWLRSVLSHRCDNNSFHHGRHNPAH